MNSRELSKYIAKAASIVNSGALLPITQNVLFREVGGELKLFSTDMETSLVLDVPNFPVEEGLNVAVEPKKLVDLLKSIAPQKPVYTFANNKLVVEASEGSYEFPTYPGEDFPLVQILKGENSTKGFMFQRAIELTQGCVSTDDLRPVMTGVYFDTTEGNVVSTNGHKLSRYTMSFAGDSFILPVKTASLFKDLGDEDVFYTVSDSAAHFATDGFGFRIRLVEGQYPPYMRVIPTNNDKSLKVEKDVLLDSLKRVSLFSNSETKAVALKVTEDSLTVEGQDVNFGNSAEEFLAGTWEGDKPFTIGINAKYLIDLLNVAGEGTIELTFSEPSRPILVKSSGNPKLLQLVMPISL